MTICRFPFPRLVKHYLIEKHLRVPISETTSLTCPTRGRARRPPPRISSPSPSPVNALDSPEYHSLIARGADRGMEGRLKAG